MDDNKEKKQFKPGNNRLKGHNGERYYATEFKRIGFTHVKTSRAASRLHDDCGIDLCFTDPFNIQIKTGIHKGLNIPKELEKIKVEVAKNFPPKYDEHNNINILIHRKQVGRGKKRNEFDDIVSMSFSDFEKLITLKNLE